MSGDTHLSLFEILPLTCTRSGTCCHGKMVWLNPWELARLAVAKNLTSREFRDRHGEFGGIRLRFNGPIGWNRLAACSQFLPDRGCSVHTGRPLACRLYPLGRERRGEKLTFIHRGQSFPCLDGCPEVMDLPQLTVSDYLIGQDVNASIIAQDEYLELMQRLADGAFALLLESGLAASGDRLTLRLWRTLGKSDPAALAKRLGSTWIDRLLVPDLVDTLEDPASFVKKHHAMLESVAQESFGSLSDSAQLREASGVMMGLALHLGRGVGADPGDLALHWVKTAKGFGARD